MHLLYGYVVYLALRRLLSASFALRSSWFSSVISVTVWAIPSKPFAIRLITEKIGASGSFLDNHQSEM